MTDFQNLKFHALLEAWRQHDELRRSSSTISELADARFRLDEARHNALMAVR